MVHQMERREFARYWIAALEDPPGREPIYKAVAEKFSVRSALYPGCGMDAVPSLAIPYVVYLDNGPFAPRYFQDRERLLKAISKRKHYDGPCSLEFYEVDYNDPPPDMPQFDLLLSQYAGPVSQAMKRFLKPGGILMVAEGPEDARLAAQSPDLELVGTVCRWPDGVQIDPQLLPPQFVQLEDGFKVPIERNFCFRKI